MILTNTCTERRIYRGRIKFSLPSSGQTALVTPLKLPVNIYLAYVPLLYISCYLKANASNGMRHM